MAFARLKEGISRTKAEIRGFLNPNHRHDDPEEQEHDRIREEIRKSHRFQSFADIRDNNTVKWHIDGHDYFWALSEMLDSAKECIFILDWWLSPEMYLRRPPADNQEWRLDRLLHRKAQQGVKIYVIVYKEVTQTMTLSSRHTKNALNELHENVMCLRHPDHIGSDSAVQFWSHHEKVVVVDNKRACIGGLDACFGRWDTHNHPLADSHPTDFSRTLFPGQDYNNARVLDFQQVDHYVNTQISSLEIGRMPWHDVHMTLIGPVVLDIVQHFIERWNEIKLRKYKKRLHIDWLALPHDVEADPEHPISRHPHLERWRDIGRQFKQYWQGEEGPPDDEYGHSPYGTCRVQVVRSVGDWSHGVLTEDSVQQAYIQLIQEAKHFIYIENQFFISNTGNVGPVKNQIAKALVDKIIEAASSGRKFKVIVVIPEIPGFAGNIKNENGLKTIMAAQYRTINRGGHSIYEEIRRAGYEPRDYIRFYHLRTYDRINSPASFIKEMEENSSVTYHEAQIAQARLWIGEDGYWHQERVRIQGPQPDFGTDLSETATTGKEAQKIVEEVDFPASSQAAEEIVKKFESGATREDLGVADSVAQHALGDRTNLKDEKWYGTEQEERDSYVSEVLYVHSKVMIVDDRRVIMGSANINDRSQKGDGDSEIALVVEDTDEIESAMDGQLFMATRFAATLRRKLFREHLGLIPPQSCNRGETKVTSFMRPAPIPNESELGTREDDAVRDPLSDKFQDLWISTAIKNRAIFSELFKTVPTNVVHNWAEYKNYLPKVKAGHLATELDLGIVKDKLSQIHGHLVEAPLEFLIQQPELVEGADWQGLNPTLPIFI
ncbi:phospholipase D/nuclease [Rhizoctonia solani 123E]|uniref:phospholipase D n=1 Tax=Rhizoctonia solani 123E TaxID=1423351 RepID=A0A074SIE2_9AGAM|nr:phospholipase D/nuclease [Rhizoctonia solani 123E]